MTEAYTKSECRNAVANLSPRQREILVRMAACKPRKEIANELGISINTVKTHVASIYERLDIKADTEAVRVACEAGLV